jgi:O-antigen ligase
MGVLIPLILITGSRAGVVLSVVGFAWAALIFKTPSSRVIRGEEPGTRRLVVSGVALYGLGIAFLAAILARAEALERLLGGDDGGISRVKIWAITVQQAKEFFPFGTGFGNFAEMFRIVETNEMLSPFYINRAHNDWLELLLSGGLPAFALLALFLVWWLRCARSLLRKTVRRTTAGRLGVTGLAISSILGLASTVDYPLRVPSLACLFIVGLVWISVGLERTSTNKILAE